MCGMNIQLFAKNSANFSPILKRRFKCKVCRNKYPVDVSMIRDVYNRTGFGDRQFAKAFNCPVCGNIYVNFGHSTNWRHESWEFFDVSDSLESCGSHYPPRVQ